MYFIIILSFRAATQKLCLFHSTNSISMGEFASFYPRFLFQIFILSLRPQNYYIMFSKRSKNLLILIIFLTFQCATAADCGDCQNCKTVNMKNECVQCMDGYRLDATGSSCIEVQKGSFQRSAGAPARIETSIADLDSSSTSTSARAVLGSDNIDPNCDIVDLNGKCRKCLDKFYLNSSTNKCQGISPLCKKWDQQGKCLSCVVGFSVNTDFKCVPAVQNIIIDKSSNKRIIDQLSFNPKNSDSSASGNQQFSSTTLSQSQTKIVQSSSSDTSSSPSDSSNRPTINDFIVTIPQVRRVVSSIIDVPQVKTETKKSLIGIPYNFQNFTGQIFTVDPYCGKYQGRVCKYCQPRYVSLEGKCKKVSNACSQWNDLGKCTACYGGFDLKDQGQCILTSTEIPAQKFDGAKKMPDDKAVNNLTSQSVTANSTVTSSQSETTIKTVVVEKPVQRRQIISSIKFIEPKPVPNCDQVGSNGLCSKCKFRYYNDNGSCKEVSKLCKAWSLTTGACTQCYENYTVSEATCIKDPAQVQYQEFIAQDKKKIESENTAADIPNCALAKKGVCETCSFKYYNLAGVCMAVSDLCNTWNQAGQCTSCKESYILSETYKGLCVSKPITFSSLPFKESGLNINNVVTQTIQTFSTQTQKTDNQIVFNNIVGCAVFGSNGSCAQCAIRYVKNNDGCKKVSDLCSAWDLATGGCTDCYPGSSLSGSECVVSKNLKRLI